MVSIYDSVDSVEMSRNIVTINNKNHRNSELGIGETNNHVVNLKLNEVSCNSNGNSNRNY